MSDFHDPFLVGNERIEEAIAAFAGAPSPASLGGVLDALLLRMRANAHVLIPAVEREEGGFELHHVQSQDGKLWLVAFTSPEEYEKGERASVLSYFLDAFLGFCEDMDEEGIVLNPWGRSFRLTRDLIRRLRQEAGGGTDGPAVSC